jgi:hypothetical protein
MRLFTVGKRTNNSGTGTDNSEDDNGGFLVDALVLADG